MGQVWGLKLTRGQRDVLLALADHADDLGNCFPGVEYLAWKTDYSERQVQRLLRQLEADKLVEVLDAGGGSGLVRRYRLHLDNGVKKSPFVARQKGDTTSPSKPKTVTSGAENGDIAMSPEPKATTKQPQKRPPPPSAAPSNGHPTTQTLLGEYLDALGHEYANKGRLATQIHRALKLPRTSADDVRAGLLLMVQKGKVDPSILFSMIDEARTRRPRHPSAEEEPPDLGTRIPLHDMAAFDRWADEQLAAYIPPGGSP